MALGGSKSSSDVSKHSVWHKWTETFSPMDTVDANHQSRYVSLQKNITGSTLHGNFMIICEIVIVGYVHQGNH